MEPIVFPQLVNGGFEQVRDDDTPYGWRKVGGMMHVTGQLVYEGERALAFRSDTTSTKWVFQTVSVEGDRYYEATAQALKSDPFVSSLFLRISWYASEDGTGEAILSVDSTEALEDDAPSFRQLTTGPVRSPAQARSAPVRLMLRPVSATAATGYFDAVTFEETAAPPPPGDRPAPEPPPAPTAPTPTPAPPEPAVFSQLTNGGFEEAREDGTPYGWRNVGGSMAVTGDVRADGQWALALSSWTGSTKWAYQTVSVQPGGTYAASALALAPPGAGEVFLRVSWYLTEDGSGETIGAGDSAATSATEGFVRLDTGPLHAPAVARSAKVRLMLRPHSDSPATAYFDAVEFGPAAALVWSSAPDPRSPDPPGHGSPARVVTSVPETAGEAAALGTVSTPLRVVNITPVPGEAAGAALSDANSGSGILWLVAGIVIGALGIAAAAASHIARRRQATPVPTPDE